MLRVQGKSSGTTLATKFLASDRVTLGSSIRVYFLSLRLRRLFQPRRFQCASPALMQPAKDALQSTPAVALFKIKLTQRPFARRTILGLLQRFGEAFLQEIVLVLLSI